jgi:micrococcal nuclease
MIHRPRIRYRRRGLAGLILALLLILAGTTTTPRGHAPSSPKPSSTTDPGQVLADAQPGMWRVANVIDGDTIDVTMGTRRERVRFIGIDTPETHDPRKPVQCFGEAAAAHTRALLSGQSVRLEADPQDSDRDKYHRLLRYVYLPDGSLVNASLIQDGYAFAYVVFPYTRMDEFRALESQAREANRGLWGGCNVDSSNTIKQTTGTKS